MYAEGVVLQEDKGPGVVEGRTWDTELGVEEDRTYTRYSCTTLY